MKNYGNELILDLHGCDVNSFNRKNIDDFFTAVCVATQMEKCELHFWDDLETPESEKQTDPQTKGTSAVQFILTSNITIHTLDELEKVFINFFSCKPFDMWTVVDLALECFKGKVVNQIYLTRL